MEELPYVTASKVFTRKEINASFTHHNLSFSDPEAIATIISNYWFQLKHSGGGRNAQIDFTLSGAHSLYGIMLQIANSPWHRHRIDAQNIATECRNRLRGTGPNKRLVPCPAVSWYAVEGDSSSSLSRYSSSIESRPSPGGELEEARGVATASPTKDPTPGSSAVGNDPSSVAHTRSKGNLPPKLAPENEEIKEVIRGLKDEGAGNLILKSARENKAKNPRDYNPRLHPKMYCDDPHEICLRLPEDCPFVVDPTPQVDMSIPDRENWEPMTIYDLRSGCTEEDIGPLEKESYIWQLFDMVRENLVNPDVARAYAIVTRAHPLRYGDGSRDHIKDEPPPTVDEIECMTRFITEQFPRLVIVPSTNSTHIGATSQIGPHLAVTRRGEPGQSHKIYFSSTLFDQVEKAQRESIPYYHLIFMIGAVLTHELGHYLNTRFWLGREDSLSFNTPRKLRLMLQNTAGEDPNDPESNSGCGEIGEIVEWLIFGFLSDIDQDDPDCTKPVKVYSWGSYSDPHDKKRAIKIDSFAAEKLLRLRWRVRMTAPQLREWLGSQKERFIDERRVIDPGYSPGSSINSSSDSEGESASAEGRCGSDPDDNRNDSDENPFTMYASSGEFYTGSKHWGTDSDGG